MKIYALLPILLVSVVSQAALGPAVSGGNEQFAVIGSVGVEIEQTIFTNVNDDIRTCLLGTSLEAKTALTASDEKTKLRCQLHGFKITEEAAPQFRVEKINAKTPQTSAQPDQYQERILCVASSGLRCWSK